MVTIPAPVLYSQAIILKTDVMVAPMTFSYSGPKVSALVKNFKKHLALSLALPEEEIREYNYSISRKEKEQISAEYKITKIIDSYSYYLFETSFSAEMDLEGNGSFNSSFKVTIFTEFPKVTFFQRSIFYDIWRTLFLKFHYESVLRKYKEEGLRIIKNIIDALNNEVKV
ncbi:MAG: hypothetical protein QXQ14_03165 [Candidatus Aenigmatarchaeota archaeon]